MHFSTCLLWKNERYLKLSRQLSPENLRKLALPFERFWSVLKAQPSGKGLSEFSNELFLHDKYFAKLKFKFQDFEGIEASQKYGFF